jgi:transposase
MGHLETEFLSSLFSFPDEIVVQDVHITTEGIAFQVACHHLIVQCPLCQQPSERLHGCYTRTIADVPCGERRVTLSFIVRKFVCSTPTCRQKIFTEQLATFVQRYTRKTNRLREALEAIGFATCGEAGAQLTGQMGIVVSASTILRYLRSAACPPPETVRILGIDDWAWRKGQTYGTILIDLERRCPIDVLPDRKEETVETWLRLHPEIEVVSRDRAGAYAEAARKGAPQAQQVADRFHLLVRRLT